MDLSKEYCLMSEKATEIQNRDFEHGDYIFYKWEEHLLISDEPGNKRSFTITDSYCDEDVPDGKLIWLPRQDQLQDIVRMNGRYAGYYNMLSCFSDFVHNIVQNVIEKDTFASGYSYERLWLMFTMEDVFNKTWNGEDWINA